MWEEVINDYTLLEKKGQGSYGCVVKAKCKATGEEVAIKMVRIIREYEYELVKVLREIQIMKALTKMSSQSTRSFFPELLNIITPSGATPNNIKNLFIVMDHVETDLGKIVKLGAHC